MYPLRPSSNKGPTVRLSRWKIVLIVLEIFVPLGVGKVFSSVYAGALAALVIFVSVVAVEHWWENNITKPKAAQAELTRLTTALPNITVKVVHDDMKYGVMIQNTGAPAVFKAKLYVINQAGTHGDNPHDLQWDKRKVIESKLDKNEVDRVYFGYVWFTDPNNHDYRHTTPTPACTEATFWLGAWQSGVDDEGKAVEHQKEILHWPGFDIRPGSPDRDYHENIEIRISSDKGMLPEQEVHQYRYGLFGVTRLGEGAS